MVDLAIMFAHADLKAVNDYLHDEKEYLIMSYGEACDLYGEKIKKYADELKNSQPLLPVTQIPQMSKIKKALTNVNSDGSTNIKGVYQDKDGLIILKYNELKNEDLEKIGFPKGSIIKGIKTITKEGKNINTGNIKFFVHGLDLPNQLAKFDAFSLISSDALLSVSYAERPESKYKFFTEQGIILDCNNEYIHGGNDSDVCSGFCKTTKDFKKNYILDEGIEKGRTYLSDLIKSSLKMDNEEYLQFVKENKNKPLQEIEPKEYREQLIKAFCEIKSNDLEDTKDYNEVYISNPKPPMAVFAYAQDWEEKISNPIEFLNRNELKDGEKKSVNQRTEFLRQYALEQNIPFVIFGN